MTKGDYYLAETYMGVNQFLLMKATEAHISWRRHIFHETTRKR